MEKLKAAVYAAQLCEVAEFATSQEAANQAMGIKARHARRGIPEQVGLARKVSPTAAAHQVSRAKALIEQLPETFDLLRLGEISEHVATIVTTETSHLGGDDRRLVDKQLADQLPHLSPRRAEAAARRLTIEADPKGAVRRAGKAREDRRVGVRPAPDTMAVLSALLPCEQGVAAYAALRRHADALKSAGDERTRGQIMADTLVERLTGQATAHPAAAEIALIMTDGALFTDDDTPADLHGYGPIPADLARDIARGGADHSGGDGEEPDGSSAAPPAGHDTGEPASTTDGDEPSTTKPEGSDRPASDLSPVNREVRRARVFLRRLFTDPVTGIITDCDPRRRRFDGAFRV